jgi:hypothetical protein
VSYRRVLPRDLFNEAKLLKCLGQLALLVHDGKLPRGVRVRFSNPTGGFKITRDEGSGDLGCTNLTLCVGDRGVDLWSGYNSRSPYPLEYDDGEEQGPVFQDDGSPSPEFLGMIARWLGDLKTGETRE